MRSPRATLLVPCLLVGLLVGFLIALPGPARGPRSRPSDPHADGAGVDLRPALPGPRVPVGRARPAPAPGAAPDPSPAALARPGAGPAREPALRQLVRDSQWTVVAEILSARPLLRGDVIDLEVQLEIERTLSGHRPLRRATVLVPGGEVELARWPPGALVLAFLDVGYEEDEGWFRPHAGPSAVRLVDGDGALQDRVDELLELEQAGLSPERRAEALAEWLVRCVEHPATRRDGLAELAPGAPFPELLRRDRRAGVAGQLRAGQTRRLVEVLLRRRAPDPSAWQLLDQLAEVPDPRIDGWLRGRLEAALTVPQAHLADLGGLLAWRSRAPRALRLTAGWPTRGRLGAAELVAFEAALRPSR